VRALKIVDLPTFGCPAKAAVRVGEGVLIQLRPGF
jgi:hypothetical protein